MQFLKTLFACLAILLIIGCRTSPTIPKYESLKNFRQPLQLHLQKIVDNDLLYRGLMWSPIPTDSAENYLYTKTSTSELLQIAKSEHAVLRSLAYSILFEKNLVDHFDFVKKHLDDTATVFVFDHEMGMWQTNPSDKLLQSLNWDTSITEVQKNELIDTVLTGHNNLRSAYTVLYNLEPSPRYYNVIKGMTKTDRWRFEETEYALFALAKFKRSEDIQHIKSVLMKKQYKLGEASLMLMKEFPDTAYLQVLERFYYRNFTGPEMAIRFEPDNFYNALLAYKDDRSAKMLKKLVDSKPFPTEFKSDTTDARYKLIEAIINSPCEAYASLISELKPQYEAYKKEQEKWGELQMPEILIDTAQLRQGPKKATRKYWASTIGWW